MMYKHCAVLRCGGVRGQYDSRVCLTSSFHMFAGYVTKKGERAFHYVNPFGLYCALG